MPSALNPDIIFKNDVIDILISCIQNDPHIGVVGCKILNFNGTEMMERT